jgi:hypothetical protein
VKKVFIVVAVVVGVGVVMKRLVPDLGKIDWEKKFESMPDNAPPKWMFRNITAIRENTERIIALLEGASTEGSGGGTEVPASGGDGDTVEGLSP